MSRSKSICRASGFRTPRGRRLRAARRTEAAGRGVRDLLKLRPDFAGTVTSCREVVGARVRGAPDRRLAQGGVADCRRRENEGQRSAPCVRPRRLGRRPRRRGLLGRGAAVQVQRRERRSRGARRGNDRRNRDGSVPILVPARDFAELDVALRGRGGRRAVRGQGTRRALRPRRQRAPGRLDAPRLGPAGRSRSGAQLWAETYERAFRPEAVFELQDDLVPGSSRPSRTARRPAAHHERGCSGARLPSS